MACTTFKTLALPCDLVRMSRTPAASAFEKAVAYEPDVVVITQSVPFDQSAELEKRIQSRSPRIAVLRSVNWTGAESAIGVWVMFRVRELYGPLLPANGKGSEESGGGEG